MNELRQELHDHAHLLRAFFSSSSSARMSWIWRWHDDSSCWRLLSCRWLSDRCCSADLPNEMESIPQIWNSCYVDLGCGRDVEGGFGTDNNSNNNRLFIAPHLVRAQSAYKDIRLHSWPDALWPDVLLSEAFFGLLSNLMTYAEVWECFALLLGTASCRVMSQWVQHFCLKFGPTPTPILSERLMHTIVSQPFFSLMDMIF